MFEQAEREAPGFAFVVRSMQIEFLKPARMDDVLDVVTAYEEVKGASITLQQQVRRGEELLVEAHVRVAFVSGGRAQPIPQAAAARDAGRAEARRPAESSAFASRATARRLRTSHVRPIYMSWSKTADAVARGYHHGNLKEALVRAALELIAQKGPAGFTFAEAARWAGRQPGRALSAFSRPRRAAGQTSRGAASSNSPAALARAWDDGRPDRVHAFDRLGKAYLRIRPNRAGLLFGHVRGRHSAR